MWDQVIDTNLGSCFNMSKAVWEGHETRAASAASSTSARSRPGRTVRPGQLRGRQVGHPRFHQALAQEGASKASPKCHRAGYTRPTWCRCAANVLEKIVRQIRSALGKADEIARA